MVADNDIAQWRDANRRLLRRNGKLERALNSANALNKDLTAQNFDLRHKNDALKREIKMLREFGQWIDPDGSRGCEFLNGKLDKLLSEMEFA